jgi:hypothetical protein
MAASHDSERRSRSTSSTPLEAPLCERDGRNIIQMEEKVKGFFLSRRARPSGPAFSRSKGKPCTGHPRLALRQVIDMDGRDKPGHDSRSWLSQM